MQTRAQNRNKHPGVRELPECVAQAIAGHRFIKGKKHYLVKWKGYSDEDNTWEPVQNLENVIQLVLRYDHNILKQKEYYSSDDDDSDRDDSQEEKEREENEKIKDYLKRKFQDLKNVQQTINGLIIKIQSEEYKGEVLKYRVTLRVMNQKKEGIQQDIKKMVEYLKNTQRKVHQIKIPTYEEQLNIFKNVSRKDLIATVKLLQDGTIELVLQNLNDYVNEDQPFSLDPSIMEAITRMNELRVQKSFKLTKLPRNYKKELNSDMYVKYRKECLMIIAKFKLMSQYTVERVNCTTPEFKEFTNNYLAMKSEERENIFKSIVLRMSPVEVEGTVKTESKELEMDLESLLVYCPETLYRYLMSQFI